MNILIELFIAFFKLGCFTFGGGYAMISLIEDLCVEKKGWITSDEMMNLIVAAESTPGPIAINCATYVGFIQCGLAGALASTLGLILPSFVIVFIISRFLDHYLEILWIARAFQGIKLAVGILILDAGFTMMKKMKKGLFQKIIMACAILAMLVINVFTLHISSIVLLIVGALLGLVFLSGTMESGVDR